MEKTEKFTKELCRRIQAEVVAGGVGLKDLLEAIGAEVRADRGRFEGREARLAFVFTLPSADGTPVGEEAEAFRMIAPLEGLKESDLGREISVDGETFAIIGWRTRASKRPIILQRVSDKKRFVYTVSSVLRALEKASA